MSSRYFYSSEIDFAKNPLQNRKLEKDVMHEADSVGIAGYRNLLPPLADSGLPKKKEKIRNFGGTTNHFHFQEFEINHTKKDFLKMKEENHALK